MNSTILSLTYRGMLGRRRALVLFVLPVIMLGFALVLRLTESADLDTTTTLLHQFGLGTLLPLLGLIAGTGVIAPEIDDGQIMYVLTKPISRPTITNTKFVAAISLMIGFAVLPLLVAGLIMTGTKAEVATAFTVGALAGGIAYSAIFLALAVASRHAVAIGLIYALVWEGLIGNFAPGARTLSVQQWALSIADSLTDVSTLDASVRTGVAVPLLVAVTACGALIAAMKLRTVSLTGSTD